MKIAEDGEPFLAGTVYLALDHHHLVVRADGRLRLEARGCPRRREAVGVILTGLGSDGVEVLQSLRDAGGCVLAEDPDTAVAPRLPGSAVRAGLTHAVGPVEDLAAHLMKVCTLREGAS